MKIVDIADISANAAKLVEHVQKTHEEVLICDRAHPAVYMIDATEYEQTKEDLHRLRRELFWRGVAEAEDEYQRGEATVYQSADALIADLGLEAE